MKESIFLLLALAGVSFANAQKVTYKDVPEVVKTVLQKEYPEARGLKWEKESSNYEAGFESEKIGYSVLIDPSGKIIETEVEISMDDLPANAKSYIARNYPEKKPRKLLKSSIQKG